MFVRSIGRPGRSWTALTNSSAHGVKLIYLCLCTVRLFRFDTQLRVEDLSVSPDGITNLQDSRIGAVKEMWSNLGLKAARFDPASQGQDAATEDLDLHGSLTFTSRLHGDPGLLKLKRNYDGHTCTCGHSDQHHLESWLGFGDSDRTALFSITWQPCLLILCVHAVVPASCNAPSNV